MDCLLEFPRTERQQEGHRTIAPACARPEDRLLMRVLDEMDYGVLLVSIDGRLIYSNELGREEINGTGPLRLRDGCVVATASAARNELRAALAGALRGRRQLLVLDGVVESLSIAVTPIGVEEFQHESNVALMVFNRRLRGTTLALDFYARSKGLTGAEGAVLSHLSRGMKPAEIAREQGVAMSTIRSQIASLRLKTQTCSIGELLDRVARLPPIRSVLRSPPRAAFVAPTPAKPRETLQASAAAC